MVSTVVGVLIATTVALIMFRVSEISTAPSVPGGQQPVSDFSVYGLIMPGILILATAPIPGAFAAIVVQRYRHIVQTALAATGLVCVSQVMIVSYWGGNVAFPNLDVLATICLVIVIPVFAGMLLNTWLVRKWVRRVS